MWLSVYSCPLCLKFIERFSLTESTDFRLFDECVNAYDDTSKIGFEADAFCPICLQL